MVRTGADVQIFAFYSKHYSSWFLIVKMCFLFSPSWPVPAQKLKIQTLQGTSGKVVKETDLNMYERLIQVRWILFVHVCSIRAMILGVIEILGVFPQGTLGLQFLTII